MGANSNIGIIDQRNSNEKIYSDFTYLSYTSISNEYIILTDTGANDIKLWSNVTNNYESFTLALRNSYNVACAVWNPMSEYVIFIDRISNSIVGVDRNGKEKVRVNFNRIATLLWGLKATDTNTYLVTCTNPNGIIEFSLDGKLRYVFFSDTIGEPRSVDKYNDTYYVLDSKKHCIHRIENNQLEIFWGEYGVPGNRTEQLNSPWGMCIYNDFMYICDSRNERIQVVDIRNQSHLYELGNPVEYINGFSYTKLIVKRPIAIHVSLEGCYVVDSTDKCLKIYDTHSLQMKRYIGGNPNTYYSCLKYPRSVEITGEYILVADSGNHSIKLLNNQDFRILDELYLGIEWWPRCAIMHNNKVIISAVEIKQRSVTKILVGKIIEKKLMIEECYIEPKFLDIHSICFSDNGVFFADSAANSIYMFSKSTSKLKRVPLTVDLIDPHFCAVINNEKLLISDTGNNRILVSDLTGRIEKVIDYYTINGKKYSFRFPRWCNQINGIFYFVDSGNSRVIAVNEKLQCVQALLPTDFGFSRPHWLYVDKSKVYISDFMNHRIAVVDIVIDTSQGYK